MRSVVCTNAACRRAVEFPDTVPAGALYACPGCKQNLPPVPETERAKPPDSLSAASAACAFAAGLTLLFVPFIWPVGIPIAAAGSVLGIFGLWASSYRREPIGCAVTSSIFCGLILVAGLVYLAVRWEELQRLLRGY
jgi:energy-converting hydrogenase Eha subunit A